MQGTRQTSLVLVGGGGVIYADGRHSTGPAEGRDFYKVRGGA